MEKYNPLIATIVSYKLFHPREGQTGVGDSSLVDLSEGDLKEIREAINIQIGAETDMYKPATPVIPCRASHVSASLREHEWMIYVLQGSKIDAIRCHRREFGSGLREAKDIVEAFHNSLYAIQYELAARCKAQRAKEGLAY